MNCIDPRTGVPALYTPFEEPNACAWPEQITQATGELECLDSFVVIPKHDKTGNPVITVETANVMAYQDPDWLRSQFFSTPDPIGRIKKLAQYVMKNRPEVLAMQEMWQDHLWQRFLKELSSLGYPYPLDENHAVHFSHVGKGNTDLAILSQYPLTDVNFVPFDEQGFVHDMCGTMLTNERFIRGVGTVVAHIDGREVLIANTHPMHRSPDPTHEKNTNRYEAQFSALRAVQAMEVWATLEPHIDDRPVILTGDLNVRPGVHPVTGAKGEYEWDVWRTLFSDFQFSSDKLARGACTYCPGNPLNEVGNWEGVLDHILTIGASLLDSKIVRNKISDHYFVRSNIAITEVQNKRVSLADILDQDPKTRIPISPNKAAEILAKVHKTPIDSNACLALFFDQTFSGEIEDNPWAGRDKTVKMLEGLTLDQNPMMASLSKFLASK